MELRPQDVVLVLKLVATDSTTWSFSGLGRELLMSTSHAFESAMRAESASLLKISKAPPSPIRTRGVLFEAQRNNLKEFLIRKERLHFVITSLTRRRWCQCGLIQRAQSAAPRSLRSTRMFLRRL